MRAGGVVGWRSVSGRGVQQCTVRGFLESEPRVRVGTTPRASAREPLAYAWYGNKLWAACAR